MILHVDFETKSILDLKICGLDRYVRKAEVLMLAWAFDNDEPVIWDPRFSPLPKPVAKAIREGVTLAAWNSSFERNIFKYSLGVHIPYEQFEDPSTFARHLSLPGSLKSVGDILGLGDEGKDKEGKRLIDLFCKPVSLGGEMTLFGMTEPYFNDPEKHAEDWEKFKEYCKQDVRVERRIGKELEPFRLPELEKKVWYLDQRINEAGLPVNRGFVRKALTLAERSKTELATQLKEKTGLSNPNSRDQMLEWCRKEGYAHNSLEKGSVTAALNGSKITPLCREVLNLRKEAAKTSYKKFEAILDRLEEDDRLRHQFLYLGAARSGRWAGSGVQVQNLPRPTKEVENNLEETLGLIEAENYEALKSAHHSVITAVTSCVRSSFQAPEGKKLVVCDLSAIENRVLGWVAGCDPILDVFRTGRDPYVAFATKMYNQSYETLLKDKGKRQIAKPAVLGCGYGLGPGVEKICRTCGHRFGYRNKCQNKKCGYDEFTFEVILMQNKYGDQVKTGLLGYAEAMGVKLTPQQAYHAQSTFRQSYPEVVQLWKDFEAAAKQVLTEGGEVQAGVVTFSRIERGSQFILRILLPSGRVLHYMNAKVKIKYGTDRDGEPYEKETIQYDGIGHGVGVVSKEDGGMGADFGPTWTYGGKLTENVVQAIARDILAEGMLLTDEMGARIVGHFHDEVAVLSDDNPFAFGLSDLQYAMSATPIWATGLPLAAEGYEGRYYRKE